MNDRQVTLKELAKDILAEHSPGTRDLALNPKTRRIDDLGPLPESQWWCNGPGHDDAIGGPWPCDAVRLARLVLK